MTGLQDLPLELLRPILLDGNEFEVWPKEPQVRKKYRAWQSVCKTWFSCLDAVVIDGNVSLPDLAESATENVVVYEVSKFSKLSPKAEPLGVHPLSSALWRSSNRSHIHAFSSMLEHAFPLLSAEEQEECAHDILEIAATTGDEYLIDWVVARYPDIGRSDQYGNSILKRAAARDNLQILHRLLLLGFRENNPSDHSGTAMGEAAFNGHIRNVSMLLSFCNDSRQPRRKIVKDGLKCAARANQTDIGRFLIKQRCLEYAPEDGDRALYVDKALYEAAFHGQYQFIKMLIDAGVSVPHSPTLVRAAAIGRSIETMALLLDHGLDIRLLNENIDGQSALSAAVAEGDSEMLRLLVSRGADLRYSSDDENWLELAAKSKDEQTVDILLQQMSKDYMIEIIPEALQEAAMSGECAILSKFLKVNNESPEHKANVDSTLIYAVSEGQIDAARLVLQHGADVNVLVDERRIYDYNRTALETAVSKQNVEMVRLLLENCALSDVTFPGHENSARDLACDSGCCEEIRTLLGVTEDEIKAHEFDNDLLAGLM